MCNDNPFISYLTDLYRSLLLLRHFLIIRRQSTPLNPTTLKEALMNYLMNRLNLRRFNFNGVLNYLTP